MIVDAAGTDRTAFAAGFDVCVVGAGPAGITLAPAWRRPGPASP